MNPSIPRPKGAKSKINHLHTSAVQHGYITTKDQTRIFYSSEGTGLPLVFCYGLVCSSLHWTYQIDYFQKHYQSIWFDYRGHQNSDRPKNLNSLNVETIAADLKQLLDELEIDKAVFVGHSMGVNVILDLFRQAPDRIHGMVLSNGTARQPLDSIFKLNAFRGVFQLLQKAHGKLPQVFEFIWKKQQTNPFIKALVSLGGFNPSLTHEKDIELYIQQVANMDPAIFFNLIQNYDRYDATAWLHTIKAPALILSGEIDLVIPTEQQELMHQLMPNSRLELIRQGSHCPQMDLHELVNLKIEKFLKEIQFVEKKA